jgi:hypothetical protein
MDQHYQSNKTKKKIVNNKLYYKKQFEVQNKNIIFFLLFCRLFNFIYIFELSF